MQILWSIGSGSVQEVLQAFEGKKPARTTIATMLSILETKQFVEHHSEGRFHVYHPLVSKEAYSRKQLFGFVNNYFNGSFSSMVSCFARDKNLSMEELDQILEETRMALSEEESNGSHPSQRIDTEPPLQLE